MSDGLAAPELAHQVDSFLRPAGSLLEGDTGSIGIVFPVSDADAEDGPPSRQRV